MSKIAIVTDTSCDLPAALLARLNVTTVPLVVRFGERTFLDTELSREEFWRLAEKVLPSTSGASLGYFVSAFQKLVDQGYHVLCLTLTSRHSTVHNSAHTAAREFPGKVTVVDSQSLSYGLGWQVLAAAEAAAKGLPLEEILKVIESVRSRITIQMVLDTLSFLRRGGRADHFISLIEKATRTLNIKPILGLSAGELRLISLSRTWEQALRRILNDFAQRAPFEAIAIGHTQRQERAERFAQELARAVGFPVEQVAIFEPSVAVASHSGPGLMAALGLSKA